MKILNKPLRLALGVLVLLCSTHIWSATDYASLKGIDQLDFAYDIQTGNPKKLALFLDLIVGTFEDTDLNKLKNKSNFVLVFGGQSVQLINTNLNAVPQDQLADINKIHQSLKTMREMGINMEGCLTAAKVFGVDHKNFLPQISKVQNAWISTAGYQAKDYALTPVY